MQDSDNRKKGVGMLKTVLDNEQSVIDIEKLVYDLSPDNAVNYYDYVYQVIGDVVSGKKIPDIICQLNQGEVGWFHPTYKQLHDQILEQNDFIKNPFEVEEGLFQCKNCGSKKVFSFSKQDRGSDEGTSVYAQCFKCKAKWRQRG